MSARSPSIVPPSFDFWRARIAGALRPRRPPPTALPPVATTPGISVVIPSRNGRELLDAMLPGVAGDLAAVPAEIIVADNGSEDGTADWLRARWPAVRVAVSPQPLSFARAVNRGIALARFSHICLLNNDMLLEPGFFPALRQAFDRVPNLFCATAQIRFPASVRREETGKAVMAQSRPEDFPLRCEEPLPGEDGTPVLYGSGGCSLYEAAKLRALGGVDEVYEPAYVEDLDLGYRAWQCGWPSIYVAGAVVEHRHRSTTRRYFSEEQLDAILEINYLRFLARCVADGAVFARLWKQSLERLRLLADRPSARAALREAANIARAGGPREASAYSEEGILALTNGCAAVFPGPGTRVGIQSVARLESPPAAGLREFRELTLIAAPPDSAAFRAALQFTRLKWGDAAVVVP